MRPEMHANPPRRVETAPRVLWIGRNIPYPLNTGANIYSGRLAEALAGAGASVRFTGFGATDAVPAGSAVDWITVPGDRLGQLSGLFSPLPIAAKVDGTSAYRRLLDAQLREHWDAIVLDYYSAGWALRRCLAYKAAQGGRPVLVHVSHNHEEAVWRSMAAEAHGAVHKRVVLWQNYLKVRALERRLVRGVDLLTAITDEDAVAIGAAAPRTRRLTLPPGYSNWVAQERTIDASTPRRVIWVGSFHWVVKQENLARFVAVADPVFSRHGIELDVVGDVPQELLATLQPRCTATRFHGFVTDLSSLLGQARIAVVPELIGGGFKLKFLDYIFARVPTATLVQAAAGVAPQLQNAMLRSADLPGLVAEVLGAIDDIDALNDMQRRAFAQAETLFRWQDRGQQLLHTILDLRPAGNPADATQVAAAALDAQYGSAR